MLRYSKITCDSFERVLYAYVCLVVVLCCDTVETVILSCCYALKSVMKCVSGGVLCVIMYYTVLCLMSHPSAVLCREVSLTSDSGFCVMPFEKPDVTS